MIPKYNSKNIFSDQMTKKCFTRLKISFIRPLFVCSNGNILIFAWYNYLCGRNTYRQMQYTANHPV